MDKQTTGMHYIGDIKHAYNAFCPWSGKPVSADSLAQYQGVVVGFCNTGCRDKFIANPTSYRDVLALVEAAHQAMKSGAYRPPMRWFGRRIGARFSQNDQQLLQHVLPQFEIELSSGDQLDTDALFDGKPVWLEVGFGGGEHLFEQAKKHPDIGFIGCEPFLTGVASLLKKIHAENIQNIRIWSDDARPLMNALPPSSIDKAFVLFADPWPKRRHQRRRFINEENLDTLSRVLKSNAELVFASDHTDYIPWAVGQILKHPNFIWQAQKPDDWLIAPFDHVATRYQQKAERKGDTCRFIVARAYLV